MASPFKSINVCMTPSGARIISWVLLPNMSIPDNSLLSVEYARSGGNWLFLADGLITQCFFKDLRKTNLGKYINDFYRLHLVLSNYLEYYSLPVQAGRQLIYPYNSKAKNLIRLALKLIELTGRTGLLLKRKTSGTKCPECTDFDDLVSVNEHCPICFGTGYVGGYYNGIPLNILLSGLSIGTLIALTGKLVSATNSFTCVAYPFITLGDVWVDTVTNQRYYIDQVNISSKLKHVPLMYRIQAHLVEYTDAVYSTTAASKPAADEFIEKNEDWDKEFDQL